MTWRELFTKMLTDKTIDIDSSVIVSWQNENGSFHYMEDPIFEPFSQTILVKKPKTHEL